MSFFSIIGELVESACAPFCCSRYMHRGVVPAWTGEGDIPWAIRCAVHAADAFPVCLAFKEHMIFMAEHPVKFYFLPDRGVIFSQRIRDCCFRGFVTDAGLDNLPFLKGEVSVSICLYHNVTSSGRGITV